MPEVWGVANFINKKAQPSPSMIPVVIEHKLISFFAFCCITDISLTEMLEPRLKK